MVVASVADVNAKDAVLVAVQRHRQAVLPDMPMQRLHVTQRALPRQEAQLRQPTGGVVDEHEQTARRSPVFEPGVQTAVDLDQFAKARPAFAQCIQARLGSPSRTPQLGRDHELTHRFLGEGNAVVLLQILTGKRGSEVPVVRTNQRGHLGHDGGSDAPIARLAAPGRTQAGGAASSPALPAGALGAR